MARSRYDDDDYDDRPRRRRDEYDDYDDDYDDRPRRRRKKKPAGPPVGLIIAGAVGGGLLLLVAAAGAFVLVRGTARDAASVPPQRFDGGPPPFNPGMPPGGGFDNPPPLQKSQPTPQPKADTPPPAQAENALTLTAVRRSHGRFGRVSLEIDYTLGGNGPLVGGGVKVAVKRQDGTISRTTVIGGFGMPVGGRRSGTVELEQVGPFGDGFQGKLEVWVERGIGPSGGTRISNIITFNG